MAEQQLIDYIKKTREAGQSDDQTRNLLMQNGWSKQETDEAFLAVGGNVQASGGVQNLQKKEEPLQNAWNEPKIRESYRSPALDNLDIGEKVEPKMAQPQTQTKTQPQPQTQTRAQVQPQKRKSILPALLVSLVLLVMVGGVAGAGWMLYTGIWSPSFSPFKLTPEKVLTNMSTNMANVKSFGSKANFQITVPDGSISITTDGNINAASSVNLKTNNEITATFTPKGAKTAEISAKFNAISIGKDYYIKISNLVLPANLNIDITTIKGKWLKVTPDSVQSILATVGTSDFGVFNQISQQSSKITDNVKNLIALASFSADLGDTTLDGVKMYHYSMKIEKAKIKSFVTQALGTSSDKSFVAGVADAVANLVGDTDIETWIGKDDFMVYSFKINKALDFKEFTSNPNAKVSVVFTENMSYPEINPPIAVPDKPQDAKVALLPIFKLQTTRNGLSQLGVTAQSIFAENKSYTSLCNRGLLNGYQTKYGTSLINLNNGIVAQGAVKPVCFAEKDNFCISTQLVDKSWICINKKGTVGKVECKLATTDCK